MVPLKIVKNLEKKETNKKKKQKNPKEKKNTQT